MFIVSMVLMHRCWFWFRALSSIMGTSRRNHNQVVANILVEDEFRDFRRGGNRDGGKEGHFENNYRRWYEEKNKVDIHEHVKCWGSKEVA